MTTPGSKHSEMYKVFASKSEQIQISKYGVGRERFVTTDFALQMLPNVFRSSNKEEITEILLLIKGSGRIFAQGKEGA